MRMAAGKRASGTLVLLAFLLAPRLVRAADVQGVEELSRWLTGTFDSRDQALRQSSSFPDARIVSVSVPRSRLGLGAPVLYWEESVSRSPNRPYRLRFLRLEEAGAGKILMRVFEPRDPIAVSGKWRDASDLALFGANDVLEKSGCLVTLRKIEDHYDGVNEGTGCSFSLSGARYLVSRVDVYKDRMEIWDRGFDSTAKQVWGPLIGPSVFLKRSDSPPIDPVESIVLPAPTPSPVPVLSAAPLKLESPAPTPQPIRLRAPSASSGTGVPASLLAPTLLVRGLGADRNLDLAEIRALPRLTVRQRAISADKGKEAIWKGVPLVEVLRRCGLRAEGMAARRLLAPAVIVAVASDGYSAAFSVEELVDNPGAAILVFESHGSPLESPEGPYRIIEPAGIRSVRDLTSIEFRMLASNSPESMR